MTSMKQYEQFSEADFITDPYFQDWVFNPDEENMAFWQNVTDAYLEKRETIGKARSVLESVSFTEEWPDDEKVERSLTIALQKMVPKSRTAKVIRVWPLYKWLSVAAVLLLMMGGAYFFLRQKQQSSLAQNGAEMLVNVKPVLPGGDKATLTLSDGRTIALDSTNNGTVSNEGGIKVTKLGGQLSYANENETAQVLYNTITTPKGGQYQLLLSDGTRVWLNAASSLRFPAAFTGNERSVELTGEGYFEVARNEAKPFRVKVNEMEVRVLGTQFNVMAYGDEALLRTTLLEGRVRIKNGNSISLLTPGQQAQINKSGVVAIDKNADTEEAVAWKNGLFHFKNADVETVMRSLSRWYNVAVVYEGKAPQKRLTGKFYRNVSITQVLEILNHTGIHSTIAPDEGGQQKIVIAQ